MILDISKYGVALILGFAYQQGLLLFWSYSAIYNPLTNYLFDCCVTDSWFRYVIYSHDLIVNLLLSFILAFALIKLNAKRFCLSVVLAISVVAICNYHDSLFYLFSKVSPLLLGYELIAVVLSCPIAILIVRKLRNEKF